MSQIVNLNRIPVNNLINSRLMGRITGVRFISKCRAGFMTISDASEWDLTIYNSDPERLINGFKKGALQTVEVKFEGYDRYYTVFARQGKKIHIIDEAILASLRVGTINEMFSNTDLYNQVQYVAVGATNWTSKAFVMNPPIGLH